MRAQSWSLALLCNFSITDKMKVSYVTSAAN